jgi:hypothetical protein
MYTNTFYYYCYYTPFSQEHLPNATTKSWGTGYGEKISFGWLKETEEGT